MKRVCNTWPVIQIILLWLLLSAQGISQASTKPRQAVGQRCAAQLDAAQSAITKQDWGKAETKLLGAVDKGCKDSFEKSQLWNFLGYVRVSNQNFRGAIDAYQKLLAEPEADTSLRTNTHHSLAQLYFQQADYQQAITHMGHWMQSATKIDTASKILLAQAYYQTGQPKLALRYLEQALAEHKNSVPPEHLWALQAALYLEHKHYSKALKPLKQLLKHYPRYRHWRQLGAIYSQLGKNLEQLGANEIIYLAGAMTRERELLALGHLYLGADAPYLAAQVLERALAKGQIANNADHLEWLAAAWQRAGELDKALPVLAKAAEVSEHGRLYARLAGLQLQLGNGNAARQAARLARKKGRLKRPGLLWMIEGQAEILDHCYGAAVEAFSAATGYAHTREGARQWLRYTQAEGERHRDLLHRGAHLPTCPRGQPVAPSSEI